MFGDTKLPLRTIKSGGKEEEQTISETKMIKTAE